MLNKLVVIFLFAFMSFFSVSFAENNGWTIIPETTGNKTLKVNN